jgi:diguanylate cyclase (GGDEF)-like protein
MATGQPQSSPNSTSPSDRAPGHRNAGAQRNELWQEIHSLEGRDLQIWGIALLIVVVVAAGFAALIFPNLMWNSTSLRVDARYLPQLLSGFIVLVTLFNFYALNQRRQLRNAREELVRQLIRSEVAEKMALIDPMTEVFNRRYLDEIIPTEVSRADRLNAPFSLLMLDLDGFKSVNTRFGHLVGDQILKEVALLLRLTFRPSDVIIRYGGDEFLILMPGTTEEQGGRAVQRLFEAVDRWNEENVTLGYKMGLSWGVATFRKGANVSEVLEAADQKMFQFKTRQARAS